MTQLSLSSFGFYNSVVTAFFIYMSLYFFSNRKYLIAFPSVSFITFYVVNFLILIYKKKFITKISIQDLDRNIYLFLVCIFFSILFKVIKLTIGKRIDTVTKKELQIVTDNKQEQQDKSISKDDAGQDLSNNPGTKELKNQVTILNIKIKDENLSDKNDISNLDKFNENNDDFPNNKINLIAKNIKKNILEAKEINNIKYNGIVNLKTKQNEIIDAEINEYEKKIDVNLIKYLNDSFVKKDLLEEKLTQINERIDLSICDTQSFVDKITHFIKIINSEIKKR